MNESGPYEAKVFNLVRGLQRKVENEPGLEAVLLPLKERAEHVLRELEERTTSGLAAMDMLEALAKEKEATAAAARESAPPKSLRGVLDAEGRHCPPSHRGEPVGIRRRGPGACGPLSQRRLRISLYNPLLSVESDERGRIVDQALAILLGGGTDAED